MVKFIRKFLKRIIIITLIICVVLGLSAYGIMQYVYYSINYFSKTVESSFNLSLYDIKKKSQDFSLNYSKFQCTGHRSIDCAAKKIVYGKDRYNLTLRDIKFQMTPYYDMADFSFNAKAKYNIIIDEGFKSLPINIDCHGSFQLLPKNTYVKMDYWCNTFVNNLKSYHKTSLYFKNPAFNKTNIYYFAQMFDGFVKNKQYIKNITKTQFGLDYITGYISNKDLFNEYVNIMKKFNPEFDDDRESTMSSVEDYQAQLFITSSIFGKDSIEYIVLEKVAQSVQNVVMKFHNKVSFTVKHKKNIPISKLFAGSIKEIAAKVYNKENYSLDIKTSVK